MIIITLLLLHPFLYINAFYFCYLLNKHCKSFIHFENIDKPMGYAIISIFFVIYQLFESIYSLKDRTSKFIYFRNIIKIKTCIPFYSLFLFLFVAISYRNNSIINDHKSILPFESH